MADTITLILNILCGVLIFFGVFWGLIRGLKKTVSRFLFLLLLSVILIFVTVPLMKALLGISINANFEINGETISGKMSLLDIVSNILKSFLGDSFVEKYPQFTELLVTLPILLINSIIYVILFWVLKLILLPINALITKLIFPKKKKAEVMGFCAMNSDETPENHNSDKIDPFMEVYKNSENKDNESQAGVFIKKENDIGKSAPSAKANKQIVVNQVTKPDTKGDIKKSKKAEKKAEKKALKQEEKLNRPKKYRLWGAFVGIFVGIITIFNTMLPVYGIVDIISENNNKEFKNISNETMSLNSITNGLTTDVVKGYELSIIGRLSDALGLEVLGLNGFDTLTSAKVDDNKIVLREDVNNIVSTLYETDRLLGLYKTATENGLENMSQENLTALISGAENVILACEQIEFVNALSEYLLPFAYELLNANDIQIVENEHVNTLILNTIKTVSENTDINVFEELKSVINLVKYLDEQKLLIKVVTNNYEGIIPVINNLDEDFETKLSEKIFAIKTIDTTLPNVLNIGLTFLDDVVKFGYVENSATEAQIKTSITNIIDNLLDTARTLSEDSSIIITDNTLIPLGQLLDNLRNSHLFNLETYNNLVDYSLSQIKTFTNDIIPENFVNVFNNQLLRNISEVSDWTTEMTVIHDTLTILRNKEYGILGKPVENQELRSGYDFNITFCDETFVNIGKALDKLEQSILLGSKANTSLNDADYENTTLTNLFACLLSELSTQLSSEDQTINDILEITELMKNNLIENEHLSAQTSTFWQDEMTAISPLIIYISDIVNGSDLEITRELGRTLDICAQDSVMLGGNTTLILMDKIINIVEDTLLGSDFTPAEDDSLNDSIYYLLQDIKTNLNSDETYDTLMSKDDFWEHEIDCFIALQNIAEEAETINSIDSANLIASDLDLIYTSNVIPASALNKTISTVLKQLKSDETTGVLGQINTLIEEISSDIVSNDFFNDKDITNFWQIELGYISELNNIKFEDDATAEYSVINNLPNIGQTIDTIIDGDENTRGSYLITEDRIRRLLSVAISDMSSNITSSFEGDIKTSVTSALNKITTNIYNDQTNTQIEINSFKEEFKHLQTLATLEIDSSYFTYTPYITSLENNLKELGEKLDSICYNTTTNELITSYNEIKNSKIITRQILSEIISSAFATAKIADPETTIETAFNNLIVDIQNSINTIASDDKVITWARELSYVSTLIQLNNPNTDPIELSNITTIVTPYLDKIAFNEKDGNFADVKYVNTNISGDYLISYIDQENTKYFNSVIITRSMLRNLLNTILEDFKIKGDNLSDEENIANELISNMSDKINISNTICNDNSLYNNYTLAFEDLNNVKSSMEQKADELDDKTIDNLTKEDLINLDKMLTDFQDIRTISGIITTRKIALMILDKIEKILTNDGSGGTTDILLNGTELGTRLNKLKEHYTNNLTSDNAEIYFQENSNDEFANPMTSLYDLIHASQN